METSKNEQNTRLILINADFAVRSFRGRNRLPRARIIIIALSFNRMPIPDPIQLFFFRLRFYLFLFYP